MKRATAFKPWYRAEFFEANPTSPRLRRVLLAIHPQASKAMGFSGGVE